MELPIFSQKPGKAITTLSFAIGPILPRAEYEAIIPENERHDMIKAYSVRLNSPDEKTRLQAAKAWSKWEYVILGI